MSKNGNNNGNDEDAIFTVVVYEWTLVAEEAKDTGEYGMQYVGQTDDPHSRMLDFYNSNMNYSSPGSKIDIARQRHGTEKANWLYKELHIRHYKSEDLCRRRGDELETMEIINHDSVEKGFNTSYGRGMKGLHHTKESKRKMSLAKMGHKVDAVTRAKISKSMKKRWKQKKKKAAYIFTRRASSSSSSS